MLLLALAACGGGGSGAVLPTGTTSAISPIGTTVAATGPTGTAVAPSGTSAATATTSSATSAFSVTGQVSSVSTGGFLIQAGSGCGYLKVVTTSATQTNLNGQTLKSGVYAQVMGSGTCSTQITATSVSLAASANGPFPAPAAAPGTTSTTATPTFSVTGQISSVNAGGFLIQAGAGCGYLKVVTSAATQTNLNGQTLKAGVYAEAWGTGSCATQITATAISLAATANGPFPAPAGVSTVTTPTAPIAPAAPAITSVTTASSASSNGFAGIVNGQQWPLSFRPFAANSPWNEGTAGHAVDANLTSVLHSQAGTYLGGAAGWGWPSAGSNDFSHPVYVATNSDNAVTTSCNAGSAYGCYSNNAHVSSLSFLVPSAARPSGGSDHHMSIVQPDGTTIDCWGASYSGGNAFNAAICATNNIVTGSGVESPSATSGASVAAGSLRADEVNAGVVPHALFLIAQCSSGYVYPGTSNASQCGGSLPIGAWIHLNMTASQIAALPASDGNKAVLTALAQYGGFLEDTGGVGNAFWIANESPEQYAAYGQPYPSFPSGPSVNWSALASSFEVLQHP